jgi:O-antigen/teichoic acid export membrane protein
MSTLTRFVNLPPIAKLRNHLRDPLYRNGYALVFSSASTSGLGMVYWIVAAHNYSTDTIGLNSALISAMIFLTNVAQLNLKNTLNRFLPNNSLTHGRMIVYAFVLNFLMAIICSIVFIIGVRFWAPELDFLASSPIYILLLIASTVVWSIFTLQDGAMIGLRQAAWVPLKNLCFALIKIILLIAVSKILPGYGVIVSWILSAAIIILPTDLLIFKRLLPNHVQPPSEHVESIALIQIIKYSAGDYFGSMVSLAAISLLPIIIVVRVSATANAYFYLSWTIAYTLYLISLNMGMSFIVELASKQVKLNFYSYRTFIHIARLLVPLVIVIVVGAPYILRLFGESYAIEGTTLLRLLCLSALPNIVVSLYTSVVRVQRRIPALILILTLPYILVIMFSFMLLDKYGVIGVGIAWLASQLIVAVVLLATEFRNMWMTKKL